MKIKNITLALCLVLCFAGLNGCKKDKNTTVSEYDATLSGIDADNNKIRDDIETRMEQEMKSSVNEYEYMVLQQNARVFQEILNVDLENELDVLRVRDHMDQAINCGIQIYGDGLNFDHYTILLTQLRQWYFNTGKRKDRRNEFILRSREYHFETTTAIDEYTCDFEVPDALMKDIEARMEIRRQKVIKELKEKGIEVKESNVNNSSLESLAEKDTSGTSPEFPDENKPVSVKSNSVQETAEKKQDTDKNEATAENSAADAANEQPAAEKTDPAKGQPAAEKTDAASQSEFPAEKTE